MLHRGRTRMKVAIMGAGALGGTFGFLLTDAGFDVTLVDVDERKVKSIRDGGLTLIMPDGGKKTLPVKITSDPAGVGKVDLVQISVKGYHTSSAAELALPMIGEDTYVLSVQNGLKNLRRIAAVVGHDKVIGGVTAHSAMPLELNVIKYNGGVGGISVGRFDGTDDPGLRELIGMLNDSGLGFQTGIIEHTYQFTEARVIRPIKPSNAYATHAPVVLYDVQLQRHGTVSCDSPYHLVMPHNRSYATEVLQAILH